MDPALHKALLDRVYDKRKAATLDLEKQVRDCLARGDRARVNLIVQQLCALLSSSSPQNVNARNGGLIGLAGLGIALGVEIAPYLEMIVPPVLACFTDPDSKIRYFACESFYNIAKVCKGEILIYFNEVFDALSKLAADSELSVKNGAELLDRLLKDIVCEAAPYYVSQYQEIPLIRARQDAAQGFSGGAAELDVAREKAHAAAHLGAHGAAADALAQAGNKAFSLARFVPLLAERMYVLSPFTRNYLVSWVTVLDSVPDLELVAFLPSFLDGLLKYLSDPNTDVRVATANVLADFLREIREAAEASARRAEMEARRAAQAARGKNEPAEQDRQKQKTSADAGSSASGAAGPSGADDRTIRSGSPTKPAPRRDSHTGTVIEDGTEGTGTEEGRSESGSVVEKEDEEIWIPGQEVRIDHAAIMEILINHIGYPDEEIQATTLQWIAEFLLVVKDVVVPFTPRLIPSILPSLAHHSPAIQSAANATNVNLYRVIEQLPAPPYSAGPRPPSSDLSDARERLGKERSGATSPPPASAVGSTSGKASVSPHQPSLDRAVSTSSVDTVTSARRGPPTITSPPLSPRLRAQAMMQPEPEAGPSQNDETDGTTSAATATAPADPFDYQTTVNALTLQFLDEHEETRVTALEWLLMLHAKAPRKILAMDDGTFPALLKTLSDPSEEVIRCDLQLLAQISSASEDAYFHAFMANLLSLFSTDRRLLETRGSLIIRQLCISLHTERIYRTMAEILEKDEDLEFASIMVQNLNIILITSPELLDFRKRLKNLDSKDGQNLFAVLYRSWCHNAVATFSLCLLAQAYEHASNLLQIFADLEITVSLLIQIDKLVQLLESPIFTALRLQLLEPEKNPYLFKCLYGLLMLLPQSSAFATLRNRLNAVSSMGFMHTIPRSSYAQTTTRAKSGRDDIKWQELLTHFRSVQARHERARRASGLATGGSSVNEPLMQDMSSGGSTSGSVISRAGGLPSSSRRRASGLSSRQESTNASRSGGSVLNPSSRIGRSSGDAQAPSSSFFGLHISGSSQGLMGSGSGAGSGSTGAGGAARPQSPANRRVPGSRVSSSKLAGQRER